MAIKDDRRRWHLVCANLNASIISPLHSIFPILFLSLAQNYLGITLIKKR